MLECLLKLKAETHWSHHYFPSWFMLTVAQELQSKVGVVFTKHDLHDRAALMKQRYTTFKAIFRYRGVWWDFPTKSIVALEDVWVKILEENPFVGAFYHKEEPAYSELACLFGLEDVKVEGAKEVIVISETIEALPNEEINKTILSDQEDEVNSPAVSSSTTTTKLPTESRPQS
ncbi:hypothetical protein SASPL_133082 [Salvia splendens]|uniref:Myb/SANT-like domain-containing protein n=1 Tax=Salvia splendens TaxID=180675 RepID=A0A8X8ZHR6_SALSN|nr:hypothetical protein SASPL_133082 [Salvia splendens]